MRLFRKANLMLPNPIRRFLWEDFIYGKADGKKKRGGVDVAKTRRNFREDVKGKLDVKKMQRAVQSDDYKKIYSVIIDSYHTTKVMKPLAEDAFMLQAAHVINVTNVLNKAYSNSQIFLLVPLQMVYPAEEGESDDKAVTRLACDLDLLFQRYVYLRVLS